MPFIRSITFKIKMLKVGLTGSIAVGKSFVCDVLRECGAAVVDADQIARAVVAPGTKGLQKIVEQFGAEILQSNGELDRIKLGAVVFADAEKRQLLNGIVHPLVIENQDAWLNEAAAESPDGIAVVDAALMIESGSYRRFDKIIVVWCAAEIQIARLMTRNDLSREQSALRIAAQMPQEKKKRYADFLIDTSDGFEATREQTVKIYGRLKLL